MQYGLSRPLQMQSPFRSCDTALKHATSPWLWLFVVTTVGCILKAALNALGPVSCLCLIPPRSLLPPLPGVPCGLLATSFLSTDVSHTASSKAGVPFMEVLVLHHPTCVTQGPQAGFPMLCHTERNRPERFRLRTTTCFQKEVRWGALCWTGSKTQVARLECCMGWPMTSKSSSTECQE